MSRQGHQNSYYDCILFLQDSRRKFKLIGDMERIKKTHNEPKDGKTTMSEETIYIGLE